MSHNCQSLIARLAPLAAIVLSGAMAACGDDDRRPFVLRERPARQVALTAARTNLVQDDTVTVKPVLTDVASGTAVARTFTFVSTAPTVASVSSTGLVRALTPGTTMIISSTRDNDSTYADTVTVTVGTGNAVATVVLAPDTTVFVGSTVTLRTTLRNASGGTISSSRPRTFRSLDTTLATVSATGVVTGRAPGTVNVTVTSEGIADTATLTVRNRPVSTVTITPNPGTVRAGSTITLTAVTTASNGAVLTGRPVTFSSDNPAIATIDPNTGVVTGVTGVSGGNPVTIRATSEGVTGFATVVVNPRGAALPDFGSRPAGGAVMAPPVSHPAAARSVRPDPSHSRTDARVRSRMTPSPALVP